MGIITKLFDFLFGEGRNVVKDTVEVFRVNSEANAIRAHDQQTAAMEQFAQEFLSGRRGRFDRIMDAINRLPRPLMALGCIGLITSAMIDPDWFALRMQGVALVPEPLWWLLGVIVSFYFGARHQLKGQEFQRALAQSFSKAAYQATSHKPKSDPAAHEENAALKAWKDEG